MVNVTIYGIHGSYGYYDILWHIMTYYDIHCQTANVYGFPYKPLMAKRINRCQSLPSGKAHPAQTDEHRCAHQRVQGHKWNGHFQRCLSWLRRLLGSAMFSLWNGIFGPTQPDTSEKKHQVSWFWMICVQVYSSLFIDMSQDHIASVRQPPWAAIRGFGAMPASLFFWTKLCKFAMRSQCFFKAENLSVFCVFSNYQAAPASGVISTMCEFMKLPSAARCGKFWTARW